MWYGMVCWRVYTSWVLILIPVLWWGGYVGVVVVRLRGEGIDCHVGQGPPRNDARGKQGANTSPSSRGAERRGDLPL